MSSRKRRFFFGLSVSMGEPCEGRSTKIDFRVRSGTGKDAEAEDKILSTNEIDGVPHELHGDDTESPLGLPL